MSNYSYKVNQDVEVRKFGQAHKRVLSIEFARLLACFLVIGVHIALPYESGPSWDISRTLIAMFVADGVGIFWMISGAFLFERVTSYSMLLKKTLFSIVIPMVAWMVFWFYFKGFLIDGVSLAESIQRPLSDYKAVVVATLKWRPVVEETGHFWYLYIYVLVMVCYPILKAFVDYLDKDIKREKGFLCIIAGSFLLNDITRNQLFNFSHYSINGLVPASVVIVLGHILYKRRYLFKQKKYIPISIGTFLVLNCIRTVIQLFRATHGHPDKEIMFWFSFVGILCAASVLIFSFALFEKVGRALHGGKKCPSGRGIYWLASYTFSVYAIHFGFIDLLKRFEIQNLLQNAVLFNGAGWISDCIYTVIITFIVFIGSFIIAFCLRKIKELFQKLFRRLQEELQK